MTQRTKGYIHAYTFGLCQTDGNVRYLERRAAGIGIHFPDHPNLNVSEPASGHKAKLTSQRAELEAVKIAVKVALENGFPGVLLYTESKYVIKAVNESLETWKRNGWKNHHNRCWLLIFFFLKKLKRTVPNETTN